MLLAGKRVGGGGRQNDRDLSEVNSCYYLRGIICSDPTVSRNLLDEFHNHLDAHDNKQNSKDSLQVLA